MPHKILSVLPPMDPIADELLKERVDHVIASAYDETTLIKEGEGAVGIIARLPGQVSAAVLDALPTVAFAFASGSGADSFDIEACTSRGIPVLNNPGVAPISVAEYTIAGIVMMLRELPTADRFLRSPAPWEDRRALGGADVSGRTLGVVGFGHIGREVARRARFGLDMQVIAYDPLVDDEIFAEAGVERVALDDLMGRSDAVTIHTPLTPQTRGLIGRHELSLMRSDAIFINSARGPIVDEGELIGVLTEGRIRGAMLDVFDPEPPKPDNPLLSLDNVFVTPHIAGLSADGRRALALSIVRNVEIALRGEKPPFIVNPEAWPPKRWS